MTIDEAIKHCLEVAEQNEISAITYKNCKEIKTNMYEKLTAEKAENECRECAADHRQLAAWLTELQELSLQIAAPRLGSIEEYHYELAKCKAAFWSCNRRCMNAEEQYRRKADELRKAQEQIAEYKRLLKAAVDDMRDVANNGTCNHCVLDGLYAQGGCCTDGCYKWRYADEAKKLIGGSENG